MSWPVMGPGADNLPGMLRLGEDASPYLCRLRFYWNSSGRGRSPHLAKTVAFELFQSLSKRQIQKDRSMFGAVFGL